MGGPGERFPRASRLRRSQEFQRAARLGQRIATQHFVVLLLRREPGERVPAPRLGVTVSARVGNAVVRNRVKRGIREWFRRSRARFDRQRDVVVIARQGAARLTGTEISRELTEVLS